MKNESMCSKERLECAANLEKPDRVPIAILSNTSAMANLVGEKYWEIAQKGYIAQYHTELKFFDAFGGWDGVHSP